MIVIIAGSRSIKDRARVEQALSDSGFEITEIVSGGAYGVDEIGEDISICCGIKLTVMKPNYDKYIGRYAPIARNIKMAKYADALVAVHDGVSRGTAHMIKAARTHGLKVFIADIS